MIKIGNTLYGSLHKISFDATEHGTVFATIYFKENDWTQIVGQSAIDLGIRLDPNVFEGDSRFKFAKRAWMFHNLVAHPLMQLCALFGFTKLGLKIHDMTIPTPKRL